MVLSKGAGEFRLSGRGSRRRLGDWQLIRPSALLFRRIVDCQIRGSVRGFAPQAIGSNSDTCLSITRNAQLVALVRAEELHCLNRTK